MKRLFTQRPVSSSAPVARGLATVAVARAALAALFASVSAVDGLEAVEVGETAASSVAQSIPTAPSRYRRPADWKPTLWAQDLQTLSREHSARVMALARAEMEKVDAVNRMGKYQATGASLDAHACPEWLKDAKLGVFIDWGPWSVASWAPYAKGGRFYPDGYENHCEFPLGSEKSERDDLFRAYHLKNWGEDFHRDHFLALFCAEAFDASALMRLFRLCGAKYVVPFLKHHGGYCLWDSPYTFRDSVDQGPRRDLAREMLEACRAEGLKFGFYFSHGLEWGYPILNENGTLSFVNAAGEKPTPYRGEMEWTASGKVAVRDFVRDYTVPQATDFIDRYDPDILWYDGDWMSDAEANGGYDIAAYFYNRAEGRKEVAVNDRYGFGTRAEVARKKTTRGGVYARFLRAVRGDFFTSETADIAEDLDPGSGRLWEECHGISHAYGNHWQDDETTVMGARELIVYFIDIVARGGNLLLLVNLDGQGALPDIQRRRLQSLGAWLARWGGAIYATRARAPYSTPEAGYLQSKDGSTRYAVVLTGARDVALACDLEADDEVRVFGERETLPLRTDAQGRRRVLVPSRWAEAELPYVLEIRRPAPERQRQVREPGGRGPTTTCGWENVCAQRREFPVSEAIWKASLDDPSSVSWEFVGGAKGDVSLTNGCVRIAKSNAEGLIVVRARPFRVNVGQGVRFVADLVSTNADVNFSSSALRAHGRNSRSLALDKKAERRNFWNGGVQTMRSIPCTSPGMSFRKYGQCYADDDLLHPAIVISGAPSESEWRNWQAEDFEKADRAWPPREPMPDYLPGACEEGAFARMLAADSVHTAEVRRVDGMSRLLVDGEIAAPVVYKVKTDLYRKGPDLKLRNASNFAGGRLDGSAVRLVSQNVDLRDFYVEGSGFSGAAMANDIRNAMRLATNSLMVACLRVNAPMDFVARHPGEGWLDERGLPVVGETYTCLPGYGTTTGRFAKAAAPWPSCSSRAWREWVKDGVRVLVAELKRQGLDKRVVGVHFSGYHDDQMTLPYTDHSRPAKEEYRQMLAEGGLISTNYAYCMRLVANRALNEFARTFKRALGKPAVAIRWCESPFRSGFRATSTDVTAFTRCDALDVMVCQPDYRERLPAFPTVSALPLDSFHLHGKLFLNEYDIRTWIRPYVSRTAPSTKSIGMAADLPMWWTMVRKLSGEADATQMGYWFYDMKGGWYDDDGIAADIRALAGDTLAQARLPASPWRPSAAVIVDESQILQGENPLCRPTPLDDFIYADQCRYLGTSGVPYSGYLAEDVLERPELLDSARIVVLAFFREIDARREALVRRLRARGATLVYLSESGTLGGAGCTGFEPLLASGDHSRRVVAEPGLDVNVTGQMDVLQTREFAEPDRRWGLRCTLREREGVRVLARYADDGRPAVAVNEVDGARQAYVCEPSGLTPQLFNWLARQAGAYVPTKGGCLQVNMNGNFLSVHCLKPGEIDFALPFDCEVTNLRSGLAERVEGRVLRLRLSAGETCRFGLRKALGSDGNGK